MDQPVEPRTQRQYAHHIAGRYRHCNVTARTTACYGREPVVPVQITEDSEGDYWSWWDHQRQQFCYTHHHRGMVEICFAYGSAVEEERGRGKLLRVRIEPVIEVSAGKPTENG